MQVKICALPAWWKPSDSPPQPENTSSVRYLGTLIVWGSFWESWGSWAADAFPLPLPLEKKWMIIWGWREPRTDFRNSFFNFHVCYLCLCPFLCLYEQLSERDSEDLQSFLILHYRPVKEMCWWINSHCFKDVSTYGHSDATVHIS